jgi:predicted S18 family serine protease
VENRRLAKSPELAEQGPYFAPVPAGAASSKKLAAASKELADWLYYNQALKISVQPELNIARDPDEDERQFRIRIQQAARERRDAEVEALTKKYGKQIDALADKVQRAQQNLNEAQAKAQAKQAEQWVNIGESVLGFFTGKSTRRAVSSATSKWNQANAAAANVEETRQSIAQLEAEKQQLEAELSAQVQEITAAWERAESNLVSDELKPKRSDVDIQTVTLGWAPAWQITYAAGDRERTDTLAAYQLPEVG